jgi:hypothetical protein
VTRTRHVVVVSLAILLDLLAVSIGFLLPALLRFTPAALLRAATEPSGATTLAVGALLWVAILSARDAYGPRVMVSKVDQALRVLEAGVVAWVLTHLLAFVTKTPVPFESRLAVGALASGRARRAHDGPAGLVRSSRALGPTADSSAGRRSWWATRSGADELALDLRSGIPKDAPPLIVPLAPMSVEETRRAWSRRTASARC